MAPRIITARLPLGVAFPPQVVTLFSTAAGVSSWDKGWKLLERNLHDVMHGTFGVRRGRTPTQHNLQSNTCYLPL